MMFADIHTLPAGIAETNELIARIDGALQDGLVGGRQQEALAALSRVFAGTPLDAPLSEALPAIGRGEFREPAFVALAAARAALQGAQYDTLWRHMRAALGRPDTSPDAAPTVPMQSTPLLDSTRHWLMELAIPGFARLDAATLLPFMPTLAQLRQDARLARLAFLLTAFVDELYAALPIAPDQELPMLRWADLWSAAMLAAVGRADAPASQTVSGTLYPLGIELRQRAQVTSAIAYGLLEHVGGAELVRLTRSRYKVDAIRGDGMWLLFPEMEIVLDALTQGCALTINGATLQSSGDLLWEPERAAPGPKSKLLDLAARYLARQPSEHANIRPLPPLDRHPVQLAEPLLLNGYQFDGAQFHLADGATLDLDPRWDVGGELGSELLGESAALFGLLRYDAGEWGFQPLSAASKAGKITFIGQGGAKLFKKPPKNNAVAILGERASRLLRK